MMDIDDKRSRAARFRQRLARGMAESGTNQSALARAVGVDRSTISQLLSGQGPRLPNAQVVAECARALGVSADWLLGLTERPERLADLLASSMSITEAPRSLVDEQIFAWHQEAAGYKIRHVPATLPDMLKTRDMLRWEYADAISRSTDQAIGAAEDRLTWMRNSASDYEIALPLHELDSFARGNGYYAGLAPELRRAQIEWLAQLHAQLYPSLRLYLFDARRVFSAPLTVLGPLIAVLYVGRHFIAFRETHRVQAMADHFDWLVRESQIGGRQMAAHLQGLLALTEG